MIKERIEDVKRDEDKLFRFIFLTYYDYIASGFIKGLRVMNEIREKSDK
jgi:hypothetical protein